MEVTSSKIHAYQPLEQTSSIAQVGHNVKRSAIPHLAEVPPFFSASSMLMDVRKTITEDKDITRNPSINGVMDIPELDEGASQVDRLTEAQACIEKDDFATLETILDSLDRKGASLLLQKLLQDSAPKSQKYDKILEFAIKKYDLNSMLALADKGGRIITIDGLELLAKHLQQKHSLQIDFTCCKDHTTFVATLESLKSKTEDFRVAVFVQDVGASLLGDSAHITPVYIERVDGKLRAVITDSTGHATKYSLFIAQKITKSLDIKPLSYGVKRQFDHTNCPVFSLRDMVHISRNPNFFNQCRDAVSPKSTLRAMDAFFRLPPSMMKVTQSLEVVKEYIADTKDPASLVELNKAIEKHKEPKNDKEINSLVARRYKKYAQIIVAKVVAQGIDT